MLQREHVVGTSVIATGAIDVYARCAYTIGRNGSASGAK